MNTGNKGKHNKDLSDYGKDCFYQADMTNRGNEPYPGHWDELEDSDRQVAENRRWEQRMSDMDMDRESRLNYKK